MSLVRVPGPVRGFTLVEVVVAMAVFSLIALALGVSLRTLAQSAERVDARAGTVDRNRVVTGLLRQVLDRVALVRASNGLGLLFDGGKDSMSWVGVMPPRFGVAGRHFFRLALEPGAEGSARLVLRYVPWNGEPQFPDWGIADAQTLMEGVETVTFEYGGEGWTQGWKATWGEANRLPLRVRLNVVAQGLGPPPLVFALRPLVPGGGDGGFTVGGGAR